MKEDRAKEGKKITQAIWRGLRDLVVKVPDEKVRQALALYCAALKLNPEKAALATSAAKGGNEDYSPQGYHEDAGRNLLQLAIDREKPEAARWLFECASPAKFKTGQGERMENDENPMFPALPEIAERALARKIHSFDKVEVCEKICMWAMEHWRAEDEWEPRFVSLALQAESEGKEFGQKAKAIYEKILLGQVIEAPAKDPGAGLRL